MTFRRFCARRIHRIRVALKLTHGKRAYQPALITVNNLKDERHLHILLLEMERVSLLSSRAHSSLISHPFLQDWAYAMEDKQVRNIIDAQIISQS